MGDNMGNEDIQFTKVKDFKADTKLIYFDEGAKRQAEQTLSDKKLEDKTNLMVEGVFGSPFKIKKITPITPDFIKRTLTI